MKKYRTIAKPSFGDYREKGSKFLAYAQPISDREAFSAFGSQVKKEHPKARHYCFAYRLGYAGEDFRASDDGEPSGTAGKPILGRILSFDLTFTAIIVVRYFGGKLLGAAGLTKAYKAAAENALASAVIKSVGITVSYYLDFTYEVMGKVEDVLSRNSITILNRSFTGPPRFTISLPKGEEAEIINTIISQTLDLPSEQVGKVTAMGGLAFNIHASNGS